MPSVRRLSWAALLPLALALTLPACMVTEIPLWQPNKEVADADEAKRIRDIVYYGGPERQGSKHELDLYLPRGAKDFPVIVLVHGGAWRLGDKDSCGLHSSVAHFLAGQGFGVAVPNYRLSPRVKHPAHIQDVARAVAWTHAHIAEHGGRPDKLFLVGHSAGGHLVSLLATDERYLQDEGMSREDIKGVIAISGVYRIPEGKMDVRLDGDKKESLRLDHMLPIRQSSRHGRLGLALLPGVPVKMNIFGPVFGDDPRARADASPINHIEPGLPPFLILSAENDLPSLEGMAKEFYQALRDQSCDVRLEMIADRNHNSIIFSMLDIDDDASRHVLSFLRQYVP